METIEIGSVRWVVAPEGQQVQGRERSVSKPKAKRRKRVSQSKQIFARANLYGLENVRKVGEGGMIDQPIETNGWLAMPPDLYDGIIPHDAWEAAKLLTKGIPIKGFLIADDKRVVDRELRRRALINRVKSVDWWKITTAAGRVVAAIAIGGAIISLLPLVLAIGAVGVALAYDPLLICVTAEDEWICLYEWWN